MKKALVIGNGPSTKKLDFSKVSIDTVGMNAAYRYWEEIDFRPTYYACLDDVVVVNHQDEINNLIVEGRIAKFFLHFNILTKYPELVDHPDVLIFEPDFNKRDPSNIFYNNFCTTGSFSIRWMLSMGYEVIGLIGIDCNYVEIVDNAEQVSDLVLEIKGESEHNPNYFFEGYQRKGDKYNIPNNPKTKVQHSVHADAVHRVLADAERLKINCKIVNTSLNNLDFENLMPVDQFMATSFAGRFKNLYSDDENRFTLLTTLYENIPDMRLKEYFDCLENNYLNPFIHQIHIFFETDKTHDGALDYIKDNYRILYDLVKKTKFTIVVKSSRPTYQDYFEYANEYLLNKNIIIANTDIYFNSSLEHAYGIDMENKMFLLTRWSLNDDGQCYLPTLGEVAYPWTKSVLSELLPVNIFKKNLDPKFNTMYCGEMDWVVNDPDNDIIHYNDWLKVKVDSDKSQPFKTYGVLTQTKLSDMGYRFRNEFSQDAWIFRTPFNHYKNFRCDFALGTFKCDSLINASVLTYASENPELQVSNPCLTIQCVHIDKIPNNREQDYTEYKEKLGNHLLTLCNSAFVPWVYLSEVT